MKVTFLKVHGAYKIGETYDLPEGSANYMVRCKIAEPAKEKVEDPATQKKDDQSGPAPKKEIKVEKEKAVKASAKEKVEK